MKCESTEHLDWCASEMHKHVISGSMCFRNAKTRHIVGVLPKCNKATAPPRAGIEVRVAVQVQVKNSEEVCT